MLAAVTGASGHAGANLIRALVDHGFEVRALVRSDTRALEGLDLDLVHGDLLDETALLRALQGADLVFHLAGAISVSGDQAGLVERINVEGTRKVVGACLQARVRRLVHFSSVHALDHGEQNGSPRTVDETRQLAARGSAYDRSKSRAEQIVATAVRDNDLDAVIVAPTGILGPHDHKPSPMGRVLLAMFRGRMPVVVDGAYDFVDARDVAAGAIAAGERGRRGERYIFAGHHRSIGNLAELAAEFSARPRPRVAAPMWIAKLAAPAAESIASRIGVQSLLTPESLAVLESGHHYSQAKARRELGWRPRPIRHTLADTYGWFRDQGRV